MAKKLILPALKINQGNDNSKGVFVGRVTVKELIDETQFKIDHWNPKKKNLKDQGYQRLPSKTRAAKIAKYIAEGDNPVFPTTILVNSRKPLIFEPENKKFGVGKLIIGRSSNDYPLWIVDGQHRVAGFRYAAKELHMDDVNKMEVPVVFLSNFSQIEEVKQFDVLNSNQKRVSTDLAQRLMHQIVKDSPREYDKLKDRGDAWQIKALVVIDLLNEKEESPWFKKVKLPNTDKIASNIVNQTSLVTSLKPLLKEGIISYYLPDEIYKVLVNYWLALKKRFPDAFLKPKENVIQKTPGIFSLHQLANPLFIKLKDQSREISEGNILELLKKVFPDSDYPSYYWGVDNEDGAAKAGSMKGFAMLADEFIDNLMKL